MYPTSKTGDDAQDFGKRIEGSRCITNNDLLLNRDTLLNADGHQSPAINGYYDQFRFSFKFGTFD